MFYDDNSISIDGPTSLAVSDDQVPRFRAHGWNAERIDGHDTDAVAAAIERAHKIRPAEPDRLPTVIAFGAPTKAGTAAAHGAPLGAAEIAAARERLGWNYPPFVVPEDVLVAWREAGGARGAVRRAWEARLQAGRPKARGVRAPPAPELPPGSRPGDRRDLRAEIPQAERPRSRPARPRAPCSTH